LGIGLASEQLRCRQYRSFGEAVRSTIRKQRINLEDRVANFVAAIESHLIQRVLPLPLAVAGVAMQLARGEFRIGLTVFCASALAVYIQSILSLSQGRVICRMRPWTPHLSPMLGLMRVGICVCAIGGIVAKRPLDWRGRKVGCGG
jgi:hypothetical protein